MLNSTVDGQTPAQFGVVYHRTHGVLSISTGAGLRSSTTGVMTKRTPLVVT